MQNRYTTSSVARLFGVTPATIKNWTLEFAAYLSPTARPEAGKRRVFTEEDLTVFALVNDYRNRGFGYEQAHIALRMGTRGNLPDDSKPEPILPPQNLLTQLQGEIAGRDQLIKQLTSGWDKERGKVEMLEKQLHEKDEQIKNLYLELAEA